MFFFYTLPVVSIFSDSHVIAETTKNNANGCGGVCLEKKSVLTKGWRTFLKTVLSTRQFSFLVSLEDRIETICFCHAVPLDSVAALSVAYSLTQHPTHVGKHNLTGDLTP